MLLENNNEEVLIDLSEPNEDIECSKSESYMYKNKTLFFKRSSGGYASIINCDAWYKPMIIYRDFLTEKLGFTLEKEYGLTDIFHEYTYKGYTYYLKCLSDGIDVISWEFKSTDEKIPKTFLDVAIVLSEIDVSQYE